MEQFNQFTAEKDGVLRTLDGLDVLLLEIGQLGVDVEDGQQKVSEARRTIESEVLRIALLGAFSDGKTSVVAAWLGQVLENMKIDMDESSDRLSVYIPEGLPGKCEIVDTPGLFGDKERTIGSRRVMYEDLTMRYISEAHLMLYVVDATNPLKDSHSDIVRWVLRDLRKLSSTIFVINKMDEVCDLRDPVSFRQQEDIKRKNLIGKLQRAAELNEAEVAQLRIVCVAANPGGRGLPFWFDKPDEYAVRSRIPVLKETTRAVLAANVPEVLRAKTGIDVVRDVAAEKMRALELHYETLASGHAQTTKEIERVRGDLEKGRREVKGHARGLTEELNALDNELQSKLRPLELAGLRAFMEDEIGMVGDDVGMKLQLRIKHIVDKYAEQSATVVNSVAKDIAKQLDDTNSLFDALGSHATNAASTAVKGLQKVDPKALKSAILVTRDLLKSLGVVIKFKPHGIDKLAGGITKWAGPAGAALQVGGDIYGVIKKVGRETTLANAKMSIGNQMMQATNKIRAHLTTDEGTYAFLSPQLQEFDKILSSLTEELRKFESGRQAVGELRHRLDELCPPGVEAR